MSERPLRVLHMAHVRWFNAEAQYALDLAWEMARQGHGISFLAQTGSPTAARARATGLPTFEEAGFNVKGLRALSAVGAALRLGRLLAGGRFDAVETHRSEGLPLIAWACRRARVPLVRVRGDMRPVRSDPFNRYLHRRVLAAVVASNSSIAANLRERLGELRRLETIHGGVDPSEFTPDGSEAELRRELGLPAGSFLVGILGRLGPVKGHADFLAAAREALAAGANASFVFLVKEAHPREREFCVQVEEDSVLRGRVAFLGRREPLGPVLRAFDLGVVASVGSEANCRVGLEWMASGVPLLATSVGVLPDLVQEGITGFLVPPRSPSRLAEKIVYLATRSDEARRLGGAARARVVERFTLSRCAEAHAALLRTLPR